MSNTQETLLGRGIELKLNGRRILKASARPINGEYTVTSGYRSGRYMTPLGELGLTYVGYAEDGYAVGAVLIDCSKSEVLQHRYPWLGDQIAMAINEKGKATLKLIRGIKNPPCLNVRLEGVEPLQDARSNNRGWWARERI